MDSPRDMVPPGRGSRCPALRRLVPVGFGAEARTLIVLSGPLFLFQMLNFMIYVVSSVFCGHLGKVELAAVTLSVAFVNVCGVSIGFGLSSACDTLMSQSFGSPNRKHVGVILQRGALVLLLCCFPCWALFLNTQHILLLCRQDPAVSRLAQEYVHVYIPALPPAGQISAKPGHHVAPSPQRRRGQLRQRAGQLRPGFRAGPGGQVSTGAGGPASGGRGQLRQRAGQLRPGFRAGPGGQFTQAVFLLLCVVKKKLHLDTWAGWSSQCLQGWGPFFRLAVPSMLMTCIEWWAYEIGSFLMVFLFFVTPHTQRRDPDPVTPGQGSPGGLEPKRELSLLHLPLETTGPLAPKRGACCQPRAVGWPAGHSPCPLPPPGRLSVLDLSAQAIIYEVATVVYMIPMGLSIAVCFRVGTALGAADTVQAKRSAVSGTLCTVGTSLVVGTLLGLLRNKLGHIFTNDEEVVALVSKVLPLYVIFHLFEAVCCLYGGVLRGTGRQAFGAVVNAVTYYVVGLPLGVVLTFVVGLGITGLWLGMLACVFLAAAAFVTYTACMDWKRAAEEWSGACEVCLCVTTSCSACRAQLRPGWTAGRPDNSVSFRCRNVWGCRPRPLRAQPPASDPGLRERSYLQKGFAELCAISSCQVFSGRELPPVTDNRETTQKIKTQSW
ncbi:multidrug and toxin extrusion protein 2-like isoform X2 [Phocoena sinus]|uniref:multidrug and toxin extrusion protein 2-like isoform X2 n=1 Tax=Phocoena sinus TaxID=42100 RepID=UPI0013C3EC94|nr:multidrug and toxin extrusion protein 2-like isoform X2 [Phocoena sinus]